MNIEVKLGASQTNSTQTFSLDELGVTEGEWKKMSDAERNEVLTKAVFALPEQPFWMVDSFEET